MRNKIHANLFVTYILANFCWILSANVQVSRRRAQPFQTQVVVGSTYTMGSPHSATAGQATNRLATSRLD